MWHITKYSTYKITQKWVKLHYKIFYSSNSPINRTTETAPLKTTKEGNYFSSHHVECGADLDDTNSIYATIRPARCSFQAKLSQHRFHKCFSAWSLAFSTPDSLNKFRIVISWRSDLGKPYTSKQYKDVLLFLRKPQKLFPQAFHSGPSAVCSTTGHHPQWSEKAVSSLPPSAGTYPATDPWSIPTHPFPRR